MAAADPGRRRAVGGEALLTAVLGVALAAAYAPLLRVIAPGMWAVAAVALTAALLLGGFALRRLGAPGAAVSAVLLLAWALAVTAVALPDDALFGVVPTFDTAGQVVAAVQEAGHEILMGTAPLTATASVSLLVVAAAGILTIALDHVVVTTRMPVLAILALVAVWLVPAIAIAAPLDALSFAVLAAASLALVRAETATRERAATAERAPGVALTASAVAAGAIAVALVVTPSLPAPSFRAGSGIGGGPAIDATLDLGENLRRPTSIPVLTMTSTASPAPNLRVATYSELDGDVWQPDRLRSQPLIDGALDPVSVRPGVAVEEVTTDIEIVQLASAFLPVPFPAVEVTGLDGLWRSVAYNRTVLTAQSSVQGQRYRAVSSTPKPTLEQMQDADAALQSTYVPLDRLPADAPAAIAELAALVTADADNDYDRLIALQSWFRGPDFAYSLDAPVEGDFDGSGADAVGRFLEVREGYCVHFASAFALMARSLGMPTRIVVGFLPGAFTLEGGQRVSEVTTDQFHAWPEVHFEGIGWVGFEPTKGLGTETRFLPEAQAAPETDGSSAAPTAAPTVTPVETQGPLGPEFDQDDSSSVDAAHLVDMRPYLTVMGVVAVVALLPLALRAVRLAALRRRARRGSVSAAWRIVRETAIDLGSAAPGAETPRAFGARIVAELGAPAADTGRLVDAVERASYAPPGGVDAAAVLADADRVRAGMLAAAEGRARVAALLLPRSLVIVPGADTR